MIFFVEVECIEFPLHNKFPVIWTKNRKVIVENVGYNKYELFYHVFLFKILIKYQVRSLYNDYTKWNENIFVNHNCERGVTVLAITGEILLLFSKLFFIKFMERYMIMLMYNIWHVYQNTAIFYQKH